mmetsp:Transcript_113276/g.360026  ORF Transcript_113276/g.360026 Transcript_113276/m.360026 type:complete len:232 (-) Transcript_113276:35-730(-)
MPLMSTRDQSESPPAISHKVWAVNCPCMRLHRIATLHIQIAWKACANLCSSALKLLLSPVPSCSKATRHNPAKMCTEMWSMSAKSFSTWGATLVWSLIPLVSTLATAARLKTTVSATSTLKPQIIMPPSPKQSDMDAMSSKSTSSWRYRQLLASSHTAAYEPGINTSAPPIRAHCHVRADGSKHCSTSAALLLRDSALALPTELINLKEAAHRATPSTAALASSIALQLAA